MKPIQTPKGCLTTLRSFKTTTNLVMLAAFIFGTYNNMYSGNNESENTRIAVTNIDADVDQISLKGYSENQSDILQWDMFNNAGISCFTIQCCRSNDMNFQEVLSVKPLECSTRKNSTSFTYSISNNATEGIVYYKIKATYQDNHIVESDFICIKRIEKVNSLSISGVRNENGHITISFKSPKTQTITLNIATKSGQLLAVNNINASEGENTFSYDAGYINATEMLIFSLNNDEEQITKKYMLASIW